MTAWDGGGGRNLPEAAGRPRPQMNAELAPDGARTGGGATMTASVATQQFAAAPAATIATAVQAERPRAGEKTIRLGGLLPEGGRAAEGLYAFLYFTRETERHATTYYAPPGAQVHADAVLCRAPHGQRQGAVLALARVCGGSGAESAAFPAPAPADGEWYPETVPVTDDGDEFEASGLVLERIVGTDNDEYEDAAIEERAAAAERIAGEIGGVVYTQVDLDGDRPGIAYERGLHTVNRTGVYAVARAVRIRGGAAADGEALAGIIAEADVMVSRVRPDEAWRLVAKAAKLLAESEHDAREGTPCDEVPDMLNAARNDLAQAAAAYRQLADNAEAAAASVHRAWTGAAASLAGRCPVQAALRADVGNEEYVDEWHEMSSDMHDVLYQTGENSELFTDEYRRRREAIERRQRDHDAACTHRECVAAGRAGGTDGGVRRGA